MTDETTPPRAEPTLATYLAAMDTIVQWSEPPAPEGVSPDEHRSTIRHTWAVVRAAAQGNVQKAQAEPEQRRPDPTVPEKRPRKATKRS